MAKINPNLLPEPPGAQVEKISVPIPKQGDFTLYLRLPAFSELLSIQETIRSKAEEWEKTGDWYPGEVPVKPSRALWEIVVPALALQVTETGEELAPEDRYYEQELVPIIGRVPAVYLAVATTIGSLFTLAQGSLPNDSKEGAESPSRPA